MGIKIKQELKELIPEGKYVAEVLDIVDDRGDYGPQLRFTFSIDDGEYSGHTISGWASKKFTLRSKLYGWVQSAFNAHIPQEYDLDTDDLLGRKVNLRLVITKNKEGVEVNKIEEIDPYESKKNSDDSVNPSSLFPNSTS